MIEAANMRRGILRQDIFMRRFVFCGIMTLFLASCAMTVPVAVITHDGHILRGENEASLAAGTFTVTDGKLTCTGSYNPLNESRTITVTVSCSDGRTGIAIATRDSAISGGGKVTLSDGSEATFIFGPAANKI
jgi:hypothetical protein